MGCSYLNALAGLAADPQGVMRRGAGSYRKAPR
jgi:hypothetical protein